MSCELVPYDDIASFYDEGWIADVLFQVKSGKEASVYCCRADRSHNAEYFALKLYRSLAHRRFRDDAVYQEGRYFGGGRTARAIRNKTGFGREVQFASWLGNEFVALARLRQAGATVPLPVKLGAKAILLEYIGDVDASAPQLRSLRFAPDEAAPLLIQALANIEIMLTANVVHGDLSAYNMLYHQGRLFFIDFPQAVDARFNANARTLLGRDVENVCRYFLRQGIACEPIAIADDLWRRFERAEL